MYIFLSFYLSMRGFLPQKNNEGTNSNVTINMNKPTIFSANDNSKIVINQANSKGER
jgi:hypothetical protein